MTGKEFLAAIGWTQADLRHPRVLQELHRLGATDEAIKVHLDDAERRKRATYRRVLLERLLAEADELCETVQKD